MDVEKGTESEILNAEGHKLLMVLKEMNLLHMNDATRAMLRDKYPEVFERLLEAEYSDSERRLVGLLRNHK
jgi:hypothetical protein